MSVYSSKSAKQKPDPVEGTPGGPVDGKERKGRAPFWAVALTVLGVLVAVTGFGGMAAAHYYLGKLTGQIETTDTVLNGDSGNSASTGKIPSGAFNLLMLGLDTRDGWQQSGELSRSDTIIILHVSATHDQAYMISIPRDTIAHIPADSTLGFDGATTKINAAYAFGSEKHGWQGGARLATEAVAELTGLKFSGVVQIDFGGFKNVINALGGVYMCVERDTWSSHYSYDKNGKIVYDVKRDEEHEIANNYIHKKGCRDLPGWDALDYARQRYGLPNSDYDRQRHQQQLIRAMAKKATSTGVITNPSKVASLVEAAGAALKMDTNGVQVNDFIFGLKAIAGADLIALKTNSGTYASVSGGEGITQGTKDLFAATAADNLGPFISENPEYLIPDAS
ncbi:LCP family protein [Hamadaea tsunoensis]|uniref:LCP family protein n=1 Tax=Hamadaea tsunoensis TaxID=53368 RepID=UPI00041DD170|nr:LCP family protein [Hamadaea tsunoensis]